MALFFSKCSGAPEVSRGGLLRTPSAPSPAGPMAAAGGDAAAAVAALAFPKKHLFGQLSYTAVKARQHAKTKASAITVASSSSSSSSSSDAFGSDKKSTGGSSSGSSGSSSAPSSSSSTESSGETEVGSGQGAPTVVATK